MHTKRERERKRTTKRNTNRLRELKKGIRVRVWEKMKTLEERKKEIQKFIRNTYIKEIKKWRNKEKWKMINEKNSWEIEKKDSSRVFIFI